MSASMRRRLVESVGILVICSIAAILLLDRVPDSHNVELEQKGLSSVLGSDNLDATYEHALQMARQDTAVERQGFEHSAVKAATAPVVKAPAAEASVKPSVSPQAVAKADAMMRAAKDLEKAAALDMAARNVYNSATGQPQMSQTPVTPKAARPQQAVRPQQAAPTHTEAQAAPRRFTHKEAEEDMSNFFDQQGSRQDRESGRWKMANAKLEEQAKEIKELKSTMQKALFGRGSLKKAAAQLAKELRPKTVAPALAEAEVQQRVPQVEQAVKAREENKLESQAYAQAYAAAEANLAQQRQRSFGVPMPTKKEGVKLPGVNVMLSATPLLNPNPLQHQPSQACKCTHGARYLEQPISVRTQDPLCPYLCTSVTSMETLPIVCPSVPYPSPLIQIASWVDPRISSSVATTQWKASHPVDQFGVSEGGAQLASMALPPPPAAEPEPAGCPPCAFLADCSLNPAAVGKSRASGMKSAYPANPKGGQAWGGGGEHISTLRTISGGVPQSQPLWNKLEEAFKGKGVNGGRALLQADEGGQQLASMALPPPAAPEPEPEPELCECPACKLGDEKVGFEDEHHTKNEVPSDQLVEMVDEELMRLDPHYAQERMDGGIEADQSVMPLVKQSSPIWAKGKANPLSDFTEDNADFTNQVARKNDGLW